MELLLMWFVFAMWCVGQAVWLRHARVLAPIPPPARTAPSRRHVAPMRDRMSSVRGATPEFMAGLGYQEPFSAASSKGSGVMNVSAHASARHASHATESVYR